MWPLDVATYELRLFHTTANAPPSAILSHTSGDGEVLFHDLRDLEHAKGKQGWQKIAYNFNKRSAMASNGRESTPAALTEAVAPSFRKLSIQCSRYINSRDFTTCIWLTSRVMLCCEMTWTKSIRIQRRYLPPRAQHYRISLVLDGGREDGRSRSSSLRPEYCFSTVCEV